MENNLREKALEGLSASMGRMPDQIELLADYDHVSIPTIRFEELVRAEDQLDIVLRAYQSFKSYQLDDVLVAVFGPRPKEDGDGAQ